MDKFYTYCMAAVGLVEMMIIGLAFQLQFIEDFIAYPSGAFVEIEFFTLLMLIGKTWLPGTTESLE